MASQSDPTGGAQKRDQAVKGLPDHAGERATTRDTTPAVERPGKEQTQPNRPPVK